MFEFYPHPHHPTRTTKAHYNALLAVALSVFLILCSCTARAQTELAPVFPPPHTPDEGWAPLAKLLNALTPDVDTSIPLSGSEINRRIYQLIQNGRAQEALEAIERREAQLAQTTVIGTDVQLLFLKGRAYDALAQYHDAFELYKQMTLLYPELPEPWNNLALEYVRQGNLNLAEEALAMALTADPNDKTALQNLGEVRLMQAEQTFQQLGTAGQQRAAEVQQILR